MASSDPGPNSALELLDFTPLKSAACRGLMAKLDFFSLKAENHSVGLQKF